MKRIWLTTCALVMICAMNSSAMEDGSRNGTKRGLLGKTTALAESSESSSTSSSSTLDDCNISLSYSSSSVIDTTSDIDSVTHDLMDLEKPDSIYDGLIREYKICGVIGGTGIRGIPRDFYFDALKDLEGKLVNQRISYEKALQKKDNKISTLKLNLKQAERDMKQHVEECKILQREYEMVKLVVEKPLSCLEKLDSEHRAIFCKDDVFGQVIWLKTQIQKLKDKLKQQRLEGKMNRNSMTNKLDNLKAKYKDLKQTLQNSEEHVAYLNRNNGDAIAEFNEKLRARDAQLERIRNAINLNTEADLRSMDDSDSIADILKSISDLKVRAGNRDRDHNDTVEDLIGHSGVAQELVVVVNSSSEETDDSSTEESEERI